MLRYAALPACAGLILGATCWLYGTDLTLGGAAFAVNPSHTSPTSPIAKTRNQDAVSALKLYLASHPSLARSAKMGIAPNKGKPDASAIVGPSEKHAGSIGNPHRVASAPRSKSSAPAKGSGLIRVAQKRSSGSKLAIPSAADKRQRGQGDDLLVPIDKSKRQKVKRAKGHLEQ